MLKLFEKIITVSIILLHYPIIISQHNVYKFDRITVNEGLTSNSLFALLKDNAGFIWVGGEYGFNRYDGNSIKVYSPMNVKGKMSDGWIVGLCEDGDFIWCATTRGVNTFNKKTEEFVLYVNDSLDGNSISANQTNKVIRTKSGQIWISTINGLNKYDRINNNFIRYKHNPSDINSISSDIVLTVYEDSKENLWIGTAGGLDMIQKGSTNFIHYKNIPGNEYSLSNNSIGCIYEDSKGNMWISTANGIDRLDVSSGKFYKIIDQRNANSSWGSDIANIIEDYSGDVWFASSSIGINIYNPQRNTFKTLLNNPNDMFSLCGNYVSSLYKTDSIIWVTSAGGGMCNYISRKWKFDHYRSIMGDSGSLSSPIVWSICEDKDRNIWVATNTGLNIYNRSKGRFILKKHNKNDPGSLSDDNIRYVYRDRKNDMWVVAIGYALNKYIPETGGFKHYNDSNGRGFNGTCFLEDSKGNYWFGLWNGIRIYDNNMNLISSKLSYENGFENFADMPIFHIYEDRNLNIWIASLYALFMYDTDKNVLTKYINMPDDTASISHSSAVDVIEDENGYYWITTYGGGLNKFDPVTKKFRRYTEKEGLAHNLTYGILSDDAGNLWINSNGGISKFNLKTETFTNYGLGDGVQGLEFASGSFYKSESGEIFFGGVNGFNGFYPSQMPVNNNVPNIAVTSFKVFNREAELPRSIVYTDEINLSYWDNFFSFEFAVLDFTNPLGNKCRYKLEGLDKNWIDAGYKKTASYTNLSPGDYVFRVIGANNDGIWNNEGKSIKISISPPWWQKLWFRVSAVTLILFIIGFNIQRKFAGIKKEKVAKEEFARQLISSQEQERKLIAHELHDSLVQDLLVVKNKAALSLRKPELTDDIKRSFFDISDGISSTMQQVRDISHKLKPHEIDRFGLTRSLNVMAEKINGAGTVNFKTETAGIDKIFNEDDEVNLFRIVQECINNILKHSEAKNALLKITKDEKSVSVIISDDGKGFDADGVLSKGQHLSFGLSGITERVSLMKGKTNFKSSPGKGTLIEIIIPVK